MSQQTLAILPSFCLLREVSAELEVTQELVFRKTLSRTTILKNVFEELGKTPIQCRIKWTLLRCVATDGKNVGSGDRCTRQIHKACQHVRCLKSVFILCITCQQGFCGMYLNLSGYWTSSQWCISFTLVALAIIASMKSYQKQKLRILIGSTVQQFDDSGKVLRQFFPAQDQDCELAEWEPPLPIIDEPWILPVLQIWSCFLINST